MLANTPNVVDGFIVIVQMVILYVQSRTDRRMDRIEDRFNNLFDNQKGG